ncbi:extracellular solute-binding protein [Lederbergia citrea]|uniref:extracellular solute-binding protein n=1 Tax=Lederbergia citrea TaxID=2833581 RepID=UPI001BC8F93C|nr:extracellular solute-binding protein [Lederbergia citrea]MBS4178739.1 extracellular solute-binding protein [Lederbergia citrea]MBS4205445.1 extracellular solute-binding protein [Lederbergia citrea]
MRMKKTFKNLVALVIILLLITGCSNKGTETSSGKPKGEKSDGNDNSPIEMTFAVGRVDSDVNFPDGQSTKDNKWTRLVEEEVGVKLDVTLAMKSGDEYTQKLNALIVTNDLPDLFTVRGEDIIQMDQIIEAGLAEDLTEVFEQHASPLVKELLPAEALEPLKRDGKLYFIPDLQRPSEDGSMTWIRADWLKKLNLPEPKTFQDVIAIAEAFKDMNPKQNYGFEAGTSPYGMYSLSGLFSAYHAYPNAWIKDADGNLVNGNIQPEMKDALQSLQDLKKKGLIHNEWTVSDDGERSRQDYINGKLGIHFGKWWAPEWPLQLIKDNDPDSEWKAFPFMSIDDKPALHLQETVQANSYYVLKKGYAHPEKYIEMVNLVAEHYWGEDPQVDPEASELWKMAPAHLQPWGKNIVFQQSIEEAFKSGDDSKLHPGEKQLYDRIQAYKDGNDEDWGIALEYGEGGSLGLYDSFDYINNEFYGAPTTSMTSKQANLDKLFLETFIEIVNGADINKFDTFVDQWKKQGGDDITKEVNEWYKSK